MGLIRCWNRLAEGDNGLLPYRREGSGLMRCFGGARLPERRVRGHFHTLKARGQFFDGRSTEVSSSPQGTLGVWLSEYGGANCLFLLRVERSVLSWLFDRELRALKTRGSSSAFVRVGCLLGRARQGSNFPRRLRSQSTFL